MNTQEKTKINLQNELFKHGYMAMSDYVNMGIGIWPRGTVHETRGEPLVTINLGEMMALPEEQRIGFILSKIPNDKVTS